MFLDKLGQLQSSFSVKSVIFQHQRCVPKHSSLVQTQTLPTTYISQVIELVHKFILLSFYTMIFIANRPIK